MKRLYLAAAIGLIAGLALFASPAIAGVGIDPPAFSVPVAHEACSTPAAVAMVTDIAMIAGTARMCIDVRRDVAEISTFKVDPVIGDWAEWMAIVPRPYPK